MHKCWMGSRKIVSVYDPERADRIFGDFLVKIESQPHLDALSHILQDEQSSETIRSCLKTIFSCSPYLARLIQLSPIFLQTCLLSEPDSLISDLINELKGHDNGLAVTVDDLMQELRRFKQKIAILSALADITGLWDVMTVTKNLSLAADASVQAATDYLFRKAIMSGDWKTESKRVEETGYIVLGMGKYGAFELNYSSDIDLIIFYDVHKARLREGLDPSVFYVRLTRDLVRLLQERTADGYVFRTDLRLRPDPGSTQLALSTDAAFVYYERYGQNWERAAYIKARPVAGDLAAGAQFLNELSPFIWRKYLDYASIAAVHEMKRQIHTHKGHGKIAIAGHNIKLGRGGIREIEFFVQTQQLIAGGRQPDLRSGQTLKALRVLLEYQWIDEATAENLETSYRFLRHLEHRLQMVSDEQTHVLPKNKDELERIAFFAGFSGFEAFSDELKRHLENVQGHYARLFEDIPTPVSQEAKLLIDKNGASGDTLAKLTKLGFQEPAKAIDIVRNWHTGAYTAIRTQRADQLLTEFQTVLIEALSKTAAPDAALVSFDRFLANLPAGVQLLSLLKSNPDLLQLIADIMGTAPRLAHFLSRHSRVLDAVLDPGFFGDLPARKDLRKMIEMAASKARDYQDILDAMRSIGQEQAFLIGVRILSATISSGQAGKAYSRLASCLIDKLHQTVHKELTTQHGEISDGGSVVLAMGKLGSQEMTASSDLDLITIYDFDPACLQTDGIRPISPAQYYSRLTQRLLSALTAPTSYGNLYEVDMRLRPSGNSGPVATRLESFIEYQKNSAWTWEHMALTRARVICGSEMLRKKLRVAIREILCLSRDQGKIRSDILQMRDKVEKERGTGDIWDLKQMRGGIMDLEFIVQYYQLVSAHDHPEILKQNTLQAIEAMIRIGVIDQKLFEILLPAAELYQNLSQVVRLCVTDSFQADKAPGGLKTFLIRITNEPAFAQLEARLKETQINVFKIFQQIFN